MTKSINIEEKNLSITVKMEDLKKLFFSFQDEWAKQLAEVKRENEKKEWYDSRETAEYFNRSISTINRWKKSGYLTARTIGGRDYYSRKEIESKMGGA